MYFRSVLRTHPTTGEFKAYYRLVECYRNEWGRVCQKTLLTVGYTDLKAEQLNIIQSRLLTVQRVSTPSTTDYILQVKSPGKELKEAGMKNAFEARFEQAMEGIKLSLRKKHTVKQADKVNQRIGRVQEKYPSVARYYVVKVKQNEKGQAIELTCQKCREKHDKVCGELGVYFVRTNKTMEHERGVWNIYNLIREIENAFRTLKTDLNLRPIYHKREEATPAHLHLGLLAYWRAPFAIN